MKEKFDFYEIVLRELKKIEYKGKIIPFPLIYYRLGAIFHLRKKDAWKLLKILQERKMIKIVSFKGIIFQQLQRSMQKVA